MPRIVSMLVSLAAVAYAQLISPAPAPTDPPVSPPPALVPCGGLLGLQCPSAKQMCAYPDGTCGAADQMGVCTDMPDVCYLLYDPVCGCDGQTYGNSCLATAAGVSVASQGECPPPPDPNPDPNPNPSFCGGIAGFPCKRKREFCELNPGDCRYIADAGGHCQRKPTRCFFLYKPVCGCDGKTYANQCWARASGMSVACAGECPCRDPPGPVSPPSGPLQPQPAGDDAAAPPSAPADAPADAGADPAAAAPASP